LKLPFGNNRHAPFLPLRLLWVWVFCGILACQKSGFREKKGDETEISKKINRLLNDENDQKARSFLQKKLPDFFKNERLKIAEIESSSLSEKWEVLAEKLEAMQNIYLTAKAIDTALVHSSDDCDSVLTQVKIFAANERLQKAEFSAKDTTRQGIINTYLHYKKAYELMPVKADTLERKIAEIYEKILICVQIKNTFQPLTPKVFEELFQRELSEESKIISKQSFTRFFLDAQACQPKYFFSISFSDSRFEKKINHKDTLQMLDSVLISDAKESKKIYQHFAAEVVKFTNLIVFEGKMKMTVKDLEGKIIFAKNVPFSKKVRTQRARFRGDLRALNAETAELCERKEENLPEDGVFFREICAELRFAFSEAAREFLRNLN
jgi:hypothetical protein